MQQIIIFALIIVGLLAYGYIHNILQNPAADLAKEQKGSNVNASAQTQNQGQSGAFQNTQSQVIQKLAISVNTEITDGPHNNEILRTTTEVTFKFKGTVYPEGSLQGIMSYDTKLVGFDSDWQETQAQERTIKLPSASKQYTFYVRAKMQGYTDSTPAQRVFQIGLSPYSGKVNITGITQDKITLTTNLAAGETIDVTGWKIKGNKGEITMPQGVELYLSVGATAKDILLKGYNTINVLSGQSPFQTIKNFRLNKCFGYLKSSFGAAFPFNYSKICPKVDCANFSYLSQTCQTALNTMDDNCTALDYSKYPQVYADSSCESYASNYASSYLNYNGCLEYYSKDADFYKNEWYIYAGYSIYCRCTDTLYLFDQNGSLVSSYHYEIK